jgi:hypothetical protein
VRLDEVDRALDVRRVDLRADIVQPVDVGVVLPQQEVRDHELLIQAQEERTAQREIRLAEIGEARAGRDATAAGRPWNEDPWWERIRARVSARRRAEPSS